LLPGRGSNDGEAALVDQAVVERAERDGVVEAGLAAVEPVADVVGVQVAGVRAAGEAAAMTVAGEERAAERAREEAELSADRERLASAVLEDRDHASVAEEPPRRLRGDAGARGVARESGGVDVHGDLGGGPVGLVAAQRRIGQRDQAVGPLRRARGEGIDGRHDPCGLLGQELGLEAHEAPGRFARPHPALLRHDRRVLRPHLREEPTHAFELCRRAASSELRELGLVLRGGDPSQRPHLGEAEPPAPQLVVDERQPAQRLRHAYLLARRPEGDAAPEGQPMRAGQRSLRRPSAALIKRTNIRQQLVGRGIQAGRRRGDAVSQLIELEHRRRRGVHEPAYHRTFRRYRRPAAPRSQQHTTLEPKPIAKPAQGHPIPLPGAPIARPRPLRNRPRETRQAHSLLNAPVNPSEAPALHPFVV
jgi:hypothetical protein